MSKETCLQVRGVSKSFGGVTAVHDLTVDVHKGEILGIIGPNGSGKTTLINLITGFEKKDSGKVFFKGRDITKLPPHKIADLGLTRTFQVMRPYYSLPAFKNLVVPLTAPRVKRTSGGKLGDRDWVAIDILEEIGFERDAFVPYKPASALPTGYLKRLELGRCLALRPEFIICDELLSGLSSSEIASVLPIVEKLQMGGITLMMVEHRLRELFTVANRVIALNFGNKIAEGSPQEVMGNKEVKKAYLGWEKT
jgi:branched-chain amino acid transport system ATP-binding protein